MNRRASFSALLYETTAAALVLAADPSAHQIDMSDPDQQGDGFQTGTPLDQFRLAIQTIETELDMPDGMAMSTQDVEEAQEALNRLKVILDRIETKAAGLAAQRREKPRSDRK